MKAILVATLLSVAVSGALAHAGDTTKAHEPNVCLDTMRISNTTVPNDRTILFHMQDGTVWANHLRNLCSGLRFHGFVYVATPPHQICGNMMTIRVLESGTMCMLGPFEKVHGPQGDKK
ncbi:MAG: hypothetical protein KGO02_24130 [Alphaproteobacteria bacterium]|nr:hypothetical protein [Alphaproteobacteria bacterium]